MFPHSLDVTGVIRSIFFRSAILLATFGVLFFFQVAHSDAAIVTWDGGGGDNNWSTCANWSGDTCPGTADVATFDATSTANATINANISVSGIDINAGYTGTITQSGSYTVTVGTSGYAQDTGVFAGGSNTITMNGNVTLAGGTFTSTSGTMQINTKSYTNTGATFNHNNGTLIYVMSGSNLTLNPNGEVFYNFIKTGVSNLLLNSETITVSGLLTLTGGAINTGSVEVDGDITVDAAYANAGNATFLINEAVENTTITNAKTSTFNHPMTVNKASGNLIFSGNYLTTGATDITLTSGSLDFGNGSHTFGAFTMNSGTLANCGSGTMTFSSTFTFNGGTWSGCAGPANHSGAVTLAGGTFTATSGTMKIITANYTNTGATFNHNNGTFEYYLPSSNLTLNPNGEVFYNFIKTGVNTLLLNNEILYIANDFTMSAGNVTTGSIYLQGDLNIDASVGLSAHSPLTFQGDALQIITDNSGTFGYNGDVYVNKSGGSVRMDTSMVLNAASQDLVLEEGIFDLNGFSLTVNGTSGTLVVQDGGTLQLRGDETLTLNASNPALQSGSTVTYTATSGTRSIKDWIYHHLTINGSGGTFTMGAGETLGGNLTVTAGIFDVADQALSVNGNTTINGGTLMTGTNTVVFGDAAGDSVTISAGELQIESDNTTTDLVKNAGTWTNSGGTITYNAAGPISTTVLSAFSPYNNLTVNSSGSTYTLNGAISVNGTLTLSAGELDVSASNHQINLAGTWTDTGSGSFTERGGTVVFDGTGTVNANEPFYNLTVNSAGTATLGAALDVDGTLTLTAGTLDVSASNYAITVGGDWAKTGTFTQRSGTVSFDDNSKTTTISGSTTFNNLRCVTSNKAITFTAGTTQTVNGLLTLTGASGQLITLRSTVNDSAWYLNVAGTSSVDYVDVRDSDASGGNAITHAVSPSRSVNTANNVNWSFNAAPSVTSVTGNQSVNADGDVTITFIMDDPDDDNTLQAKIEYSLDGGSTWADPPTLSTAGSETFATYGDPAIDNAQIYQVGQSGAYITSSFGANTVTVIWEAATDVLASTDISNARVRVTPYDGIAAGTASSSGNFIIDLVAPTGLSNGAFSINSTLQFTLTWTAVTENNFNHYEIWYGTNSSNVSSRSGSATEWDNSDDAALATRTTTSTTVRGSGNLSGNYFLVFAVDNYGNTSTVNGYTIQISSSSSTSSGSSGGGGGGSGSSGGQSSGTGGGSSGSSTTDTSNGVSGGSTEDTESEDENTTHEDTDDSNLTDDTNENGTWQDGYTIPDHWSSGYIKHLLEEGHIIDVAIELPTFAEILNGLLVQPDLGMSRGKATEFLLALAGYQVTAITFNERELAFTDVSSSNPRVGFIQFAYDLGLINGYPDGTFKPFKIINRAESLKMASYFFGIELDTNLRGGALLAAYNLAKNPFSDVDLNQWYAPYVIHAYANGVVSGYGDGTFGTSNAVTFAEFLKIATLYQSFDSAVQLAEELEE